MLNLHLHQFPRILDDTYLCTRHNHHLDYHRFHSRSCIHKIHRNHQRRRCSYTMYNRLCYRTHRHMTNTLLDNNSSQLHCILVQSMATCMNSRCLEDRRFRNTCGRLHDRTYRRTSNHQSIPLHLNRRLDLTILAYIYMHHQRIPYYHYR
jgi:hypothetical protein